MHWAFFPPKLWKPTNSTCGLNITEFYKTNSCSLKLGISMFLSCQVITGLKITKRAKAQVLRPLSLSEDLIVIPFLSFLPHLSLLNRSTWRTEAQANLSEYQIICLFLLSPLFLLQLYIWQIATVFTKNQSESTWP